MAGTASDDIRFRESIWLVGESCKVECVFENQYKSENRGMLNVL